MRAIDSIVVYLGPGTEAGNETESNAAHVKHIDNKNDFPSCLEDVPPSTLSSIEVKVMGDHLADYFDPLALASLVPSLKPSGQFMVSVAGGSVDVVPDVSVISTAFLLSGLAVESERREATGTRTFTAIKKAVGQAEGKRIDLAAHAEEKKQDGPVRINVKVTIGDLEDEDIIDEDQLLEEDGGGLLAPPDVSMSARKAGDDCGGRKACDNCSCGRAEQEAADVKATSEPAHEHSHKSSCGNCGKGDAFRCASCPYLGKPAFKPGEEHLVLELSDDM